MKCCSLLDMYVDSTIEGINGSSAMLQFMRLAMPAHPAVNLGRSCKQYGFSDSRG